MKIFKNTGINTKFYFLLLKDSQINLIKLKNRLVLIKNGLKELTI